MQANSITLAVDLLNTGTTTDQVYTRFEERTDRSTYIGAAHALNDRDMIQFYRTAPKRNGEFKGVARTAVKLTEDTSVDNVSGDGSIVAPLIADLSFSIPVGATPAETLVLRQRLIALLDDDSVMADLVNIQEI